MAQEKKLKIPKKSENTIPQGLVPSKSILESRVFKLTVYSIVGAVSVILISQQVGNFSETESIREIGLIFGIITGILPLTLHTIKRSPTKR